MRTRLVICSFPTDDERQGRRKSVARNRWCFRVEAERSFRNFPLLIRSDRVVVYNQLTVFIVSFCSRVAPIDSVDETRCRFVLKCLLEILDAYRFFSFQRFNDNERRQRRQGRHKEDGEKKVYLYNLRV